MKSFQHFGLVVFGQFLCNELYSCHLTIKPFMRHRIKSTIQLSHCYGLWVYYRKHDLKVKTFFMN